MMGLETLLIRLGTLAANTIFRNWLRGKGRAARPNESISSLLARRTPEPLRQRRARRQLEQVADQVTGQMMAYIDTEFDGVAQNEMEAAVVTAIDIFELAEAVDGLLLASDLDAINVERALRDLGSATIERAALSSAGQGVFNLVLRETAAYMVEIYSALPEFSAKTYSEILRRESAILTMVEKVLSRLPAADNTEKISAEDSQFETEYRRSIARKLDRLELFGATLSEFSRRYALSVAYISLSVSKFGAGTRAPGADEGPQRVEHVLGWNSKRVLIRGEAGSGKTTLLQWLAVFSARRDFTDRLKSWNNMLPIYLPLRRYAITQLPSPERFLDMVLPNLAGKMPAGWTHRLLEDGRALLLLDGADELTATQRLQFETWIADLLEQYPDNVAVVTSRPAAVDGTWLGSLSFDSHDLQPMSLQDTKSLVDHWHTAIAKDIDDPEELRLLGAYRENLKSIIEERRPIRTLATNPLICALVCALNRDRRTQLPRNRMDLYRIALEMLLERRDRERNVEPFVANGLEFREKEIILEDLAYWLIRNGQSDATTAAAAGRIGKKLAQIPHVKQTGTDVLTNLLQRSGVVRSPAEGRIDFLHKSFQEYLAAKACLESDDLPLLLRNSIDDQWRDVIIMAAGHARAGERETLISGLLEKGTADTENRHRLYLLAVACLETSTELSPAMREQVEGALAQVVPPRNPNDASAISSAGELAVPFLSGHVTEDADVVAACVRALALIGGDDAMRVIREYAPDRRNEVAREIARSWTSFSPHGFARRVLATAPLDRGSINLSDSTYVEFLPALRNLRGVRAEKLSPDQLLKLGSIGKIRHLDLRWISATDFSWLANPRIESIRLESSSVSSWEGINYNRGLRRLTMVRCNSLSGDAVLEGISVLESLEMENVDVQSLRFFGRDLKSLRKLRIAECGFLASLGGIEKLQTLTDLTLEDNSALADLSLLTSLPALTRLSLSGSSLPDLSPVLSLEKLEVIRIREVPDDATIGRLRAKSGLKVINYR